MISGHKQFQACKKPMSSQHQKVDGQSLSSLSLDPNQIAAGGSNIFGGRKSSFEYVNILKDSDQLPRRDFRNSLDVLTSNINASVSQTGSAPLRQIIQVYNDQNKVKIEQSGYKPLQIGVVYSESQDESNMIDARLIQPEPAESRIKLQTVYNQSKFNYHSYFPHDLAEVLKERQIPLEYVKGLLMVRDQKQIKTTRRLKVQRYLQKRRKKTWNRKICYNCRQKVAEQRLRIKGKFIKKRRAMNILGLKVPIQTALLKQMLYEALKNKQPSEIEQIINKSQKKKKIAHQSSQDSEIQEQENESQDEPEQEVQMIDQKNEPNHIQKKEQQNNNNDNFVNKNKE